MSRTQFARTRTTLSHVRRLLASLLVAATFGAAALAGSLI